MEMIIRKLTTIEIKNRKIKHHYIEIFILNFFNCHTNSNAFQVGYFNNTSEPQN